MARVDPGHQQTKAESGDRKEKQRQILSKKRREKSANAVFGARVKLIITQKRKKVPPGMGSAQGRALARPGKKRLRRK